jgi:hypothetical protein
MKLLEEIREVVKEGVSVEIDVEKKPEERVIGEMNKEEKALYAFALTQPPQKRDILLDLMWWSIQERMPKIIKLFGIRKGHQIVEVPRKTISVSLIVSEMD